LSFELQPGVVTGFLGPNGSGKSTTMRLIMGLDYPDAGEVLIDGRPTGGWAGRWPRLERCWRPGRFTPAAAPLLTCWRWLPRAGSSGRGSARYWAWSGWRPSRAGGRARSRWA
jgi:energy-coupling factor transporter ATP-binding protein EcfA2